MRPFQLAGTQLYFPAMFRIELMDWDKAREEASRIRFAVFVEEQRVPVAIELDEMDARSLHALAYAEDGAPVATGRLLPQEQEGARAVGHVGRMAVLKDWRGRGVGAAILAALLEQARRRGDEEIVLSAQTHALGFYRRHGFTELGPEYEEAGIPHQLMRRSLIETD